MGSRARSVKCDDPQTHGCDRVETPLHRRGVRERPFTCGRSPPRYGVAGVDDEGMRDEAETQREPNQRWDGDEAGYVGVAPRLRRSTTVPASRRSAQRVVGARRRSRAERTALEKDLHTTLRLPRQQGDVSARCGSRIRSSPAMCRPAESPAGGASRICAARLGFFGTESQELRIQRAPSCGKIRHPPRTMGPYCASLDHEHVVARPRRGVQHVGTTDEVLGSAHRSPLRSSSGRGPAHRRHVVGRNTLT